MPETPEQKARREIDAALVEAGRVVQSRDELDLTAGRGIAVRELATKSGFGDYLLYIGGFPIARRCAGVTTGWQLED